MFSWLLNKYFSKTPAKPIVIPAKVGVYLPAAQSTEPKCDTQVLAAVKIVNSLPEIQKEKQSACHTCGACCAFFIVAFSNAELDNEIGGAIPIAMTLPLDDLRSCMKGTKSKSHCCAALEGSVGHHVKCKIYENRPSTCRNFDMSWEFDRGNELCDKARLAYGLLALSQY